MKIKVAFELLQEFKYLKTILHTYGKTMMFGDYVLFPCMRVLVLNDPSVLSVADIYFGNKAGQKKFQPFISMANRFHYFCNKKGRGLFSAIYVANNKNKYREIKLFSFETRKIITICTSVQEKNCQFEQYEKFSCAYAMPLISHSEIAPSAFEVSMVELLQRPGEHAALETIARCGMGFSNLQESDSFVCLRDALEYQYNNVDMSDLLSRLLSHIDAAVLNLSVPLCMQHGDLSKDNLIYGQADGVEKYWWIDWEHAHPRVFFYDIYFYMLNAAFCSNDRQSLELYLCGECDDLFEVFFEHFGLEYVSAKKKDYFLVFAILFFKERVCANESMKALQKYCAFLEEIGIVDIR